MNQKIARLVEQIEDAPKEEKIKKIEAYVNSERQQAYFQAQAKIFGSYKKT